VLIGGGTYTSSIQFGGKVTVTFDDAAATQVGGPAPVTGTFRPVQPLSDFIGKSPFGNWNLTIMDTGPGNALCHFEFSLTVEVVPADTTPPVITPHISGTLGDNGWYTSNVTVIWTVEDEESPITSQFLCGPATITTDTAEATLTCEAGSAGGTASESVTIKRDATPPGIALTSVIPAANAHGWNNTDVSVSWTCQDATSGVVSASITQTLSSEGENQSATGTCTDQAGNTAPHTHSGIHIDKTNPTLNASVSPNPVLLNGSATALAGEADSLSGIASANCDPVNTGSVGSKSVNCSASDKAGNSATASASYSVVYAFDGFSAPVNNDGVLNIAKAGQTIPLKWRLTDASGSPVTNLASAAVTVASLSCSSGSSTDQIEEYASGGSGLQNLGNGYYQYNWQTPKNYANSCKTMQLNLGEGSTHIALFKFVK
jgi:hypothetical protein